MGTEGDWTTELVEVNRRGRHPSKVVLAHLHPGEVSTSWQQSVTNATLHDIGLHRRLVDDGRYGMISTQQGAGRLERGRNEACAYFLDNHPQADLLVMIDSDMGFDHDAVENLAQVMDETGLPIVGGLCFGAKPVRLGPQQSMDIEVFPTIYRWAEGLEGKPPGFDAAYEYPPDQLIECAATGAAFLGLSRACLQQLRDAEGDTWFDPVDVQGRTFGEDMSFCLRARRNGLPVHVHTGIRTSHHKDRWITEDSYRDERRPSSSAVSVVIPVKDRLDLTQPLVGQLVEQGGWHDLLIYDNGSETPEMRDWLANLDVADVYDATGAGIGAMWNAGIDEALRRHNGLADVVILNNDLKLGPRFCHRLIGGLRESSAMAVCGNYDGRAVHGVQPVRGISAGREDGTGGLAGFAFALRAEWVASGYRFPEDWWYFTDNDLVMSIEAAGGWYGLVGNAAVNHLGGGGQTMGSLVGPTFEADREAFEAKWVPRAA